MADNWPAPQDLEGAREKHKAKIQFHFVYLFVSLLAICNNAMLGDPIARSNCWCSASKAPDPAVLGREA